MPLLAGSQTILCMFRHRSIRLLRQQSSITVYCLPTKENNLSFSIFRLQQTNQSCCFPLVSFSIYVFICIYYIYIQIYIYTTISNGKPKTGAQVIFLDLFTVCSLCKWKFVICPFIDKGKQCKLSVFKRTKWTKWTKWTTLTCLSMCFIPKKKCVMSQPSVRREWLFLSPMNAKNIYVDNFWKKRWHSVVLKWMKPKNRFWRVCSLTATTWWPLPSNENCYFTLLVTFYEDDKSPDLLLYDYHSILCAH